MRMVSAFNAVKELAAFPEKYAGDVKEEKKKTDNKMDRKLSIDRPNSPLPQGAPTININIQLQLPSDATGEIYEKFFDAMKTKLFP